MSQAKTNEWLHADKGAPWKRAFGGMMPSPHLPIAAPHAPAMPHMPRIGGGITHLDTGGTVDPTSGTIGGIAPSATTMNPLVQGQVQRYASLPTEKLTEYGAMLGGTPQGQIIQRLLQQRRTMPQAQQAAPQQQAQPVPGAPTIAPQVPIAQKRGGATPKRAVGGDMGISPSQGAPWWTRSEARGATGFLQGSTPGRADAIETTAPAGAYVIPADVISGLGEGNSLAGARIMQGIVSSGPGGIPLPQGSRGHGPPRPPEPAREAKGGGVHASAEVPGEQTPVALSHGEYVVPPEHVMHWGGGDLKRGHRIFDRWVEAMRAQHIKKLKSLPGPVKS
jgi:hypothetical protein